LDGANELIEVRRVNQGNGWNVKVGQYRYDADGIRIWRKTDKWDDEGSDTIVQYAYDRAGSLPYLIKDEKWLYVWGDGRLLYQSRHDGSGTQYAHTDAQGTLIAQTEMSREIKRRFPSDIAHPIVAGWPIYDQAIQYTGHISDSWEHGPNFNYMRARYQEQATSRFLSRDTWAGRDGRPQSKNRYAYAEGNPASRVDPSGYQSPGGPAHTGSPSTFCGSQQFLDGQGWTKEECEAAYAKYLDNDGVDIEAKNPDNFIMFTGANFTSAFADLARRLGIVWFPGGTVLNLFPMEFEAEFQAAGINIWDPRYGFQLPPGQEMEYYSLTRGGKTYSQHWSDFFMAFASRGLRPTKMEIYQWASVLASPKFFNFPVYANLPGAGPSRWLGRGRDRIENRRPGVSS
jgi:RHS repeat-associated protein